MTNSRKTPESSSQFELEQLKFFLNGENIPSILSEINPSLSWLPVFIGRYSGEVPVYITNWISQNFNDPNAIIEVSRNLHYFSMNSSNILEENLEIESELDPILYVCWKLIVSHIRNVHNEYNSISTKELNDKLMKGDKSANFVTNLANISSPYLKLSEKLHFLQDSTADNFREPSDLLNIEFVCNLKVKVNKIVQNWQRGGDLNDDICFLKFLVYNLQATLNLATLAGLEEKNKVGITDIQVLSVAPHKQNYNKSGFLPIVQLIPEIWRYVHNVNRDISIKYLEEWLSSKHRLFQRLALHLYTDSNVPASLAGKALIKLPIDEQVRNHICVELHELIKYRWNEFDAMIKRKIEQQIICSIKNSTSKNLDQSTVRNVYELLQHIKIVGKRLGKEAQIVLSEIENNWPEWQLGPEERLGFLMWTEEGVTIRNDAKYSEISLNDESCKKILSKWRKQELFELNEWGKLCSGHHELALSILHNTNLRNQTEAWNIFLTTLTESTTSEHEGKVLCSFDNFNKSNFDSIAVSVSYWLNRSKYYFQNRNSFLKLWDRVFHSKSIRKQSEHDYDYFTKSANHPIGNLTESIINLSKQLHVNREPIDVTIINKFDMLLNFSHDYLLYSQLIFSHNLSTLFEILPEWTKKEIIPLFHWNEPNAAIIWSSLKYSRYIHSSKLFELLKEPVLELFSRKEVSEKEKCHFANWLVEISISNISVQNRYPIKPNEIRSALRKAGSNILCSVADRLSLKLMNSKPNEIEIWTNILSPIFYSIWPIDRELQNSKTSEMLVELLCNSGNAFPDAVDQLLPFIRQDQSQYYSSLETLYHSGEELFKISPHKMLELIDVLIGEGPIRNNFLHNKLLDRIILLDSSISKSNKYKKLKRLINK